MRLIIIEINHMDIDETWIRILKCIVKEKSMTLPRGSEFIAKSNIDDNEITIIPNKTGISQRISYIEWSKFVEKFNEVEKSGYDPLRSRHYAKVSFNSSYIIAILKVCA